jgi:hypothetical protein
LLCVLLFAAGVSEPSNAASLSVSGNLDSSLARSYTLEELQALPGALNKTVGSDTYQGVSLWSLLGGSSSGSSGIIPVGTVSNSILRSFVSATGSDGARSLISVGEINPRFGGLGDPVLVAFSKNGTVLPAPVLVDAEDASQTRNIANLASLEVSSLPQPSTGAPGGPSTQLALTGVTLPATFDLAALQALPATTLTGISFNSGPAFDYTGVKLWDLLNLGGIDAAAIARGYVLARATDDVSVFFALGEIDPLSRGPQDILIAYDRSSGGLGTAGFARVVVPGDDRGGRYLSNVVALEVGYIQAVPEAQTWILMIVGLGMVAFLARRRISRQ